MADKREQVEEAAKAAEQAAQAAGLAALTGDQTFLEINRQTFRERRHVVRRATGPAATVKEDNGGTRVRLLPVSRLRDIQLQFLIVDRLVNVRFSDRRCSHCHRV